MGDPLELAGRCEAATGPDRELDAAIYEALGHKAVTMRVGDMSWISHNVHTYTASLDAAMSLVPDDWGGFMPMPFVHKRTPEQWQAGVGVPGPKYKGTSAYAATAALAMCAAALRARAAVPATSDGEAGK